MCPAFTDAMTGTRDADVASTIRRRETMGWGRQNTLACTSDEFTPPPHSDGKY